MGCIMGRLHVIQFEGFSQSIPFPGGGSHLGDCFTIYSGTILLDEDGVKIVQVPNSLDVEVAWHLQHHTRSIRDSDKRTFNENYAVKVGKLVPQDTGPDIIDGTVSLVDAKNQ